MKESKLQKDVKKAIKREFPNAFYYHPKDRSERGVVDILMCFYGHFVGIELKRNLKEKTTTPLQAITLRNIIRAGGYAFASDSVDDVIKMLKNIAIDAKMC